MKITVSLYEAAMHAYEIENNYDLSEDQLRFTAHPLQAVQKAEEEAGRIPFVIVADGAAAGFFVLHDFSGAKDYSSNPNAILLRAFSVSLQFQRKGVAGKALSHLKRISKTHFPQADEIVLGVNEANHAAQRLYDKHGFFMTGAKKLGRSGYMDIMSMPLHKKNRAD